MKSYHQIALLVFTSITLCIADSVESLNKFNSSDELVLETRAGVPGWARKYTRSRTGCPCWWDLTLGDICACCKDFRGKLGQPCGYPLHNYCQKKSSYGCPGLLPQSKGGVDYERYTLSTRGYPCHYDKSDVSCAWCAPGYQQCGKAGSWANDYLKKNRKLKKSWQKQNTCLPVLNGDRKSYAKKPWVVCVGQVQDCNKRGSECDINADCLDTGIKKEISRGNIWSVHRCACKDGFVGNGITCADETTGIVTRPGVELKAKLTTDVYEQYKLDINAEIPNHDNFMDTLDDLLDGGSCGGGCNADVVTCPTKMTLREGIWQV